jgi:DNA-directed RNA polymerase subunit beta
VKTYEAIIKGQNVPKPGIPESFKVLIKELQSLGLDVKVLDENQNEIDLKQHFDDDDDAYLPNENTEQLTGGVADESELESHGYMEDTEANSFEDNDSSDDVGVFDDVDMDSDEEDDFSLDDIFASDSDSDEQF